MFNFKECKTLTADWLMVCSDLAVRTRFKLISSKKLSLKPINKAIEPARRVDIHRASEIDGRRMSSVLFGTA
jgi:hypothetical protein